MGLSKARFVAVLTLALLWSSIQCAAQCASEPCASQASPVTPAEPPCHHHHAPSNQTPAPCQHRQLAQADVPQSSVTSAPAVSIAAMIVPVVLHVELPLPPGARAFMPRDVSWPPSLAVVSSVILRI